MKKIFITFIISWVVQSVTLVQLLGLSSLLEDLAKLNTVVNQTGQASSAYMLNPNIHTFLKQYKTRTQFCDYKCQNFFNLPCFLLFGCNIHIRNFILVFFVPIFSLSMTGLCCGKGIWSFSCWMHYLALFTGVKFVIWAIKKCAQGGQKSQATDSDNKMQQIEKDQNQEQINNIQTSDRLQSKESRSSQSSSQN